MTKLKVFIVVVWFALFCLIGLPLFVFIGMTKLITYAFD